MMHDRLIINASEFCRILNSSDDELDPSIIWKTFQRFLRTVRVQKQQALQTKVDRTDGGDDDDDDGENNEDEAEDPSAEMDVEDTNAQQQHQQQQQIEPPRKKIKKEEAWKADTAKYQVPFVGTAVLSSAYQSPDEVQSGIWPTGLLKAYLMKSPLAVELIDTTTGPRFVPQRKWYQKLIHTKQQQQQQHNKKKKDHKNAILADQIVNAFWKILTILLPNNPRLIYQFCSTMTMVDVISLLKSSPLRYAETIVPFLTVLTLEQLQQQSLRRRRIGPSIARELEDTGIQLLPKLLHAKSKAAKATIQLVIALQPHDAILAIAFPIAIQQHHQEGVNVIGDLIHYVTQHLNRSWYFFTRDVLKTLCRISGADPLLKALVLNVHQSPLYARKSNEPLLLRLVAQHMLPDTNTVTAVLHHRPRCLEQFYEELPAILPPDATHSSVETIHYMAKLRTLTILTKEFPEYCNLPKNFHRQHILKMINGISSNPLVAYQTLVYLSAVLDNFHSHNASIERKTFLLESFPDVTSIVNAIAKIPSDAKSNGLLWAFACTMVSKLLLLLVKPRSMDSANLDLTKCLPKTSSFVKLPPSLQKMIIQALQVILDTTNLDHAALTKLFKALMELLFMVRSTSVYYSLRDLAIYVFVQMAKESEERDNSLGNNIDARYEASLWVDGLSIDTLIAFHTIMLKANRSTVPAFLQIAKAWKTASLDWPVPNHFISTTMLTAIQDLPKSSGRIAILVAQVTLRMIFYSECPLVLAALVVESPYEDVKKHPAIKVLWDYCSSLVHNEEANSRWDRLAIARETVFPNFVLLNDILGLPNKATTAGLTLPFYRDQAREIIHVLLHGSQGMEEPHCDLCKESAYRILPLCAIAAEQCTVPLPWKRIRSVLGIERPAYVDVLLLLSTNGRQQQRIGIVSETFKQQNRDLLLYLVSDLLLAEDALELSVSLLHRYEVGSHRQNSQVLLNAHCLRTICRQEFTEKDFSRIQSLIAHAISVWVKIGLDKATCQERQLLQTIELMVAQVLQKVESGYIGMMSVPAQTTVQKCLASKRFKLQPDSDCCLLSTLLKLDEVAFKTAFLDAHNTLIGTEWYDSLIIEGKLDKVLGALGEASSLIPDSLLEMIDRRCSRLIHSLRNGDTVHSYRQFISLLFKFKSFLAQTVLSLEGANALVQELISRSETEQFDNVVELAVILCAKKNPKFDSERNDSGPCQFGSLLLKVLCTTIRKRLRRIAKPQVTKATTLCAECSSATMRLREALTKYKLFHDDELKDTTVIIDLVKSCLRFSINVYADGFESLRIDLLELIYGILAAFRDRINFGKTTQDSVSSMVSGLISSHSQFVVVCEAQDQTRLQSAIFSILYLCLQMNHSIPFEAGTWKIFSKAFSASPSPKDTLVLRVIETYAKRATDYPNLSLFQMVNFRTPLAKSVDVDESVHAAMDSWDWLPESIVRSRIEKTLGCFPYREDVPMKAPLDDTAASDDRYMPSFVMDMTIAALHQLGEAGNEETLARFSKSLCDKGLLALAIASLCSASMRTRKIAVAILAVVDDFVNNDSAKKLQTWKDRPQHAMLIRAVRYCCCIRSSEQPQLIDGQSNLGVSEVPSFTSLYLARASLILSQAGHPLYEAINRSLLAAENDCGSFQDLSRVPGFIALFCSSSTDIEQLNAERAFALRLIRDACIMPECFHLLTKCRAPELLMASVYTSPPYVSLHERLNEQLLIVDVFGKILKCLQTSETYSDFIGRRGFLAWLRCCLSLEETWLPQSYAALLHLFSSTLHKSFDLELGDVDAISGMAIGMASRMMETTLVLTLAPDNASIKAKKGILIACCEGLVAIDKIMPDSYRYLIHPIEGFAAATATQFINKLVEHEAADDVVLVAICDLPFQNKVSIEVDADDDMLKFCARLLSVINTTSNTEAPSDVVYHAVMTRVCGLIGLASRPPGPEMLRALISCRKQCSKNEGTRTKWIECFSMVGGIDCSDLESNAH